MMLKSRRVMFTNRLSISWSCQTNRLKHHKPWERGFYEAIRECHSVRAASRFSLKVLRVDSDLSNYCLIFMAEFTNPPRFMSWAWCKVGWLKWVISCWVPFLDQVGCKLPCATLCLTVFWPASRALACDLRIFAELGVYACARVRLGTICANAGLHDHSNRNSWWYWVTH